ncbi:MAG: RNA polymerase sigma factor [Pseudomonadota bacterium]
MSPSRPSGGAGDESELVRTFFEKRENLLLFLAARTRDMATAEDLVQDLYLKISTLGSDADVRAPSALLYRMASNLLVDHVRSRQRASRRDGDWRREAVGPDAPQEASGGAAADEVVIAKERVRQLTAAVTELPPQMQRAFRLHKLEGRSQAETAQVMGVSVKMIEQHIQAAIARLAQRLRT